METPEFKMIGRDIKMFRTEKGLTQKQLGKFIGTSSQCVMNWESGKACPPDKYWKKLNKVFGDGFYESINYAYLCYLDRKIGTPHD